MNPTHQDVWRTAVHINDFSSQYTSFSGTSAVTHTSAAIRLDMLHYHVKLMTLDTLPVIVICIILYILLGGGVNKYQFGLHSYDCIHASSKCSNFLCMCFGLHTSNISKPHVAIEPRLFMELDYQLIHNCSTRQNYSRHDWNTRWLYAWEWFNKLMSSRTIIRHYDSSYSLSLDWTWLNSTFVLPL